LLGFYQQLRLYKERKAQYAAYNLEKPLWVFVGSSVSKASATKGSDQETVSDIVRVLGFIARFLAEPQQAIKAVNSLLTNNGAATGLVDSTGHDIFHGAFLFLRQRVASGEAAADVHADILETLFNNRAGGQLQWPHQTLDSRRWQMSEGMNSQR